MQSFAPAALAAIVAVVGWAGAASAQYRPGYPGGYPGGPGGGAFGRPTTSPYLNLLGRGNAATNYFGIVRPQQQLNAALFGGVGAMGGGIEQQDPTDPELRRGTGHVVAFNFLSHYYYNNPATAGMMGGGMGGGVTGASRFNTMSGGVGASGGFGQGGFSGRGGSAGSFGGGLRGGSFAPSVGGFGVPRR